MKILILAQNPKTIKNLTQPLAGTKSHKILKSWLEAAEVPEEILELRNAVAEVGASTDVLKAVTAKLRRGGWVEELIGYPVIVCLGRIAEKAILETRQLYFPNVQDWDHFFLPHPSGLNRQLNDPEVHLEAVEQLKEAHRKFLTLKVYEGRI